MPALTIEAGTAGALWSRRASTSGQRSSPLMVEAVPSVIESPKATITAVSDGAIMSTASTKNQEVVEFGNASSPRSLPWRPAFGPVRYEVVSALACHVIG